LRLARRPERAGAPDRRASRFSPGSARHRADPGSGEVVRFSARSPPSAGRCGTRAALTDADHPGGRRQALLIVSLISFWSA
jgi:hypothetical protein